MRRAFMFALAVVFAVSLAFAQAGPKKEEKSKPDSTRTKQAAEKDTTKTTEKAKEQGKEKGEAAKEEAAKEKGKAGDVRKTEKKVEKTEKTQKTESAEKAKQEPAKAKDKEPQKAAEPEAAKQKTEKPAAKEKAQPAAKTTKENAQPAADSTRAKTGEKPGKRYAGDTPLSGHLKRAMFTTAVEDHEPVGSLDSLSTATEQVYFFTDIVGLEGHTVTHRWIHDGEVLAEVPIEVGGPRWRAASSKKLLPGWTGEWVVEVVDSDGTVLGSKHFVYYKAQ